MRYSGFFILTLITFYSSAAYSFEPKGNLQLLTGVGFFKHPEAPASSLNKQIKIDHTENNKGDPLQIGPRFQLSLRGLLRHKSFAFLLTGQISHTSTLYSKKDIFSAYHTSYSLESGMNYKISLSKNVVTSFEPSLQFSENKFQDLHLVSTIRKLSLRGSISFRWKSLKMSPFFLFPIWSSYSLEIYKENVSDSRDSKGIAYGGNIGITLSKRIELILNTEVENFEILRFLSQKKSKGSRLLKPLERGAEKIILDTYHFSLGTKIKF